MAVLFWYLVQIDAFCKVEYTGQVTFYKVLEQQDHVYWTLVSGHPVKKTPIFSDINMNIVYNILRLFLGSNEWYIMQCIICNNYVGI